MANSQPLATVVAVIGKVLVRTPDGETRLLYPGDVLYEGEVVVTPPDGHVELDFGQGTFLELTEQQTLKITNELSNIFAPKEDEGAVDGGTLDRIVEALDQNRDIDLELEAPAAGGGFNNDGNSFVRLMRVLEATDPFSFDFIAAEIPQNEIIDVLPADETPNLTDTAVNDFPEATDDSGTTAEDTVLVVNATAGLLANDTDLDGDILSVDPSSVGTFATTAGGSITIAADGSYTYTPPANYNGADSFNYTVTDGSFTDTATLDIAITDTIDPTVVTLTADASVAEGGNITYTATVANAPQGSDLVIDLDNGAQITIAAGAFSGNVVVPAPTDDVYVDAGNLTVAMTGAAGGNFEALDTSDTATTAITDTIEISTVSLSGPANVTEGATTTDYTVTLSDPAASDVTVDLTYSGVAADGTDFTGVASVLVANGTSSQTFTIDTLEDLLIEGAESFTITISTISGGGFENLIAHPVNNSVTTTIVDNDFAPVTDDVSASGVEDDTFISITLTGSDDGTVDSFSLSSLPTDGILYTDAGLTIAAATGVDYSATGEMLTLYFVPDPEWSGSTSFDFAAKDDSGMVDSTPATATINVANVDDPSILVADTNSGTEDGGDVTGNVLTNDSDVDDTLAVATFEVNGDATTYNGGDTAAIAGIGTLEVLADGSYTFTPAADWNGDMPQVTYTTNTGSSTTLDITVTNVNDAPALDLDANNSSGATGDNYQTTFTEGGGGVAIADTDVAITDVDDANIESATITITDVETDDLLIVGTLPTGITAGSYDSVAGTITLSGSASLADYQQAIRAIQFDNVGDSTGTSRTIEVTINDGDANSNTAVSTVNINTLPTVSIDDVSVQEPSSGTTTLTFTISIDQTLGSDLTFNYQTVDVSALAGSDYVGLGTMGTITAGSTSTTVTVTINSDADVYEGDESFTLDLSNFNQTVNFQAGAHLTGGGIQGIGTIGVNNGPPDAVDDSFVTAPDTPLVTGNVLTNDLLVDNADYSTHDGTSAQGGTVTYNGDGTFTYSPASGFSGTDTFTYTIIDDDGQTDTAIVSIDVTNASVNPPVVASVPDISYTENDAATNLLTGISLSDVDSSSLSSVVVKVGGYLGSQDVLDYLTAGTSVNASVSVSGGSWKLTLTNGADINEYLTVLNTLTYENSSDNPSASARTITVEAYDETYNNLYGSDAGSLTVVPVNDAPEVFDNDAFFVADSQDNGLNISVPTDPDTDDSSLVITVTGLPGAIGSVTLTDGTPVNVNDTLTLAELAGLQFDAGSSDGSGDFTYSVFDGALTTVGTMTINVGDTQPDSGTVYESALIEGTGSDGGSTTVTGNLFANDAAAGSSIDSVDFGASNYTPTGGVITIDTGLGTLTVYADNTTPGHSAGDYIYQLTSADGSGGDVTENFTYNFTNIIPLSDDLTITVEDDEPIANDLNESVPESEEQIFNVVLTLDISTSMNDPVGTSTRLELAKDSLIALSEEYFNQSSQVQVTVLLFANGAHELGSYSNFTDVETAVSAVTDVNQTNYSNDLGGGNLTNSTSYVDATALIEQVMTAQIATQNPADGVRNISYFLSDGAITADGSPVGNGYDDFVNSNAIASYSVGIGTGLPGDLTDLNYIHNIDSLGKGYGTVNPALIVEDVSQLQSELLSTVPTAFGGNITVDLDASIDNVLFGADTGYVESIGLDLGGSYYSFTYDGSTITVPAALVATVEVDGSTMILNADDGFSYGTLNFDFSDGSYTFSAPNGTAPSSFDFDFSVVDGDGDSASATATISIVDDAPDARDDLHSVAAYEVVEGNVISAVGTDGGPAFGVDYTPFATQGGGVDKVVDDAVVTEFNYKGSVISLDLALVTTTIPAPPPTGNSEDLDIDNNTNWSNTNITLSSNAGINNQGAGVSGGRSNATLDDQDNGEALTISFDRTELPYGVNNLVLTINDFQGNNNDEVTVAIYDIDGNLLGTEIQPATNNQDEDVDLSAYTGIGSVNISYTGGGWDCQLSNVAFDPHAPATIDVTSLDQTSGDNGDNLSWVYNYDYDLDGNVVFDATVTDTNDGSTFVMRSNGYYQYTPDQSGAPVPVTVSENFTDGSADQGITVTTTANGNPVITYNGPNGIGVNSNGDTWSDSADSGDNIILTFDQGLYPDGVEEITLSFGYDAGAGTAIFYDEIGAVIDSVALSGNNSQTFSGISGVNSIEITTGATGDYSINQIDFTVPPDSASLPNTLDPIQVDYTLTDSDGQSDTAQLAIYTIDNTITGTVSADSITGGDLNDAITGDSGNDTLSGGAGHDSISGGAGSDLLHGNAGDDYLSGGDDSDTLYGDAGNDHVDGDAGSDIVDGGTGDDIVQGGSGDDLVFGGAGDDVVQGETGNDTLYGGAGNDILDGGDGIDTLIGGQGDDTLTGGIGVDTFKFVLGDEGTPGTPSIDTVTDFKNDSNGDILDLRDLLQGEDQAGGNLEDYMHFELSGTDTIVHVSSQGNFSGGYDSGQEDLSITMQNIDLTSAMTLTDQQIIQDLLNNGKLITD